MMRHVLVAALGLAACARSAAPPPAPAPPPPVAATPPAPDPPPPPSPVKPKPVVTSAPAETALPPAAPPTCLTGIVKTAGATEIPVARAKVTLFSGGAPLADLPTQEDGTFRWCSPRAVEGASLRLTVRVEKPQFKAIEKNVSAVSGGQTEVSFALEATID